MHAADRQSERELIPTLTDSFAGVGGWKRRKEKRKKGREGGREEKKFKCLGFHTVNLAVQSPVAPFSHSFLAPVGNMLIREAG